MDAGHRVAGDGRLGVGGDDHGRVGVYVGSELVGGGCVDEGGGGAVRQVCKGFREGVLYWEGRLREGFGQSI